MTHPFMAAVGDGLAERRVATMRFQFPFAENGAKRADSAPLALCDVAVPMLFSRARGMPWQTRR